MWLGKFLKYLKCEPVGAFTICATWRQELDERVKAGNWPCVVMPFSQKHSNLAVLLCTNVSTRVFEFSDSLTSRTRKDGGYCSWGLCKAAGSLTHWEWDGLLVCWMYGQCRSLANPWWSFTDFVVKAYVSLSNINIFCFSVDTTHS